MSIVFNGPGVSNWTSSTECPEDVVAYAYAKGRADMLQEALQAALDVKSRPSLTPEAEAAVGYVLTKFRRLGKAKP